MRAEWRIVDPRAVLEIAVEPLLRHAFDVPAMEPLPVYPSVARDLAIIVEDSVRHQDVLNTVLAAAPGELVDVRLFDIYRGEGVGAGRKSLAYTFTYQSRQRTLTDEDANRLHEKIMQAVVADLKAEIRAG